MNVTYEKKDAMTFIGFHTEIKPEEGYQKCPEFWDGLFKEALPLVDKMYITEVELIIEDGDTFFSEFEVDEFEVAIGETFGEEVKYTRTYYTRKK